MKKMITPLSFFLAACILAFAAGYFVTASLALNNTVKIGHREFAEQRILGQLLAVYLESKGYQTEVYEYSDTWSIFNALQNGDIDVYTEYTGSVYGVILNQSKALGVNETYQYVKNRLEREYGITILKPLGWNNTYLLSVRPETAKKYRLKTISDLIPVANQMILGSDPEFANRNDGLLGLSKTYVGLQFKNTKAMEQARTYQALVEGITDVNVSYSTDAQIEKFGLINLIDDKNFFPPYYVAPILKMSYAEKNPELVVALEALANQWTEKEITQYNFMVDEGQDPRAVAERMLREKGLL